MKNNRFQMFVRSIFCQEGHNINVVLKKLLLQYWYVNIPSANILQKSNTCDWKGGSQS